jgi:post-segregation antitoxin (ccd killing protein)
MEVEKMARIPRKTKKITVYLTDYQYDQLYTYASVQGLGVSILANIAINQYLENSNVYLPVAEMKQMQLQELKSAISGKKQE